MKGWLQKNWPITLILLIAAALRFYRFWELPYTHDELSALLRAQVHSWSEFIETGVKLDNHPAGVQLLIFLQTLVSYEEWWIKLPYLVLGVWSVWLIYINGRILNLSESGSLFAASLLAVSQYTISYSQWARPYSVGLFLVLLLTWVLLKFRDDESKSFRWLMWYSIVAALTGYVHYFTLLQAIIVSVFFLPFLNKRQRIQLALAGVFSALMWLPHIGITLHQMGRGGIGEWLHVPESGLWL
ncbi:MAG: glycosyltransferase family 39 protein, partial [Flavobacteriales bacterium]